MYVDPVSDAQILAALRANRARYRQELRALPADDPKRVRLEEKLAETEYLIRTITAEKSSRR